MKTIAFKDRQGGSIHAYFKTGQTRWERFYSALEELKRTGNIIIYRVKGKKIKKLKVVGM